MKWMIILFVFPLLLIACKKQVNSEMELKMKRTNNEFLRANHNFPSNDQFYILNHFQLDQLNDTLSRTIDRLFVDSKVANELKTQVYTWLKDSLFVMNSIKKGTVLFDRTNLEQLEDPLKYYLNEKFDIDFEKTNSALQTLRPMFKAKVGGHFVQFELIPTNGKLIQHKGEYVIVSTGKYQAKNLKTATSRKSIKRFTCDLLQIDWFINLNSDHYFEKELSIQLSDSTLYYDPNWKGKLID